MFPRNQLFLFLTLILWSGFAPLPQARAQWTIPILNPQTYVSPSGAYSLHVNPSDRYGQGKGTYRLSRKGKVLWEKTLPFTLWKAAVTNDGLVGGFAYSNGPQGFGGKGPGDYGYFEVVILTPTGKVRLDRKVKRAGSRFEHRMPNPAARGLIVDGANNRLTVRVDDEDVNRGEETWWTYQFSTGRELRRFAPKQEMKQSEAARFIIDAQSVTGTPLTLLHWWRYGSGDPANLGARFTLIDPEGRVVWSLELPKDYNVPGNEDAQDALMDAIRKSGAILRTNASQQFTLRFVAQKQRVTFNVKRGASGAWQVAETGRDAYLSSPPKDARFTAPEVKLALRNQISLRAPGPQTQHPIRRVSDLIAAGPGRLAFVRYDAQKDLVVVNDQGTALYTVPLASLSLLENDQISKILWQKENTFLVFVDRQRGKLEDMYAEAFQVEAQSGTITKLAGFRSPSLDDVAMFSDGGFVVLATVHIKYTSKKEVYAYDIQGKQTWALTRDFGYAPDEGPEMLFSPESLTVLQDSSVAVLDVIQHTVQLYDRSGHYTKTISLDKAWQRKANYPSDIRADAQGGFFVHDFGGTPSVVWMNTEGKVLGSFTPHSLSGTAIENPDLTVGSDSRLWVSDSYTLLRMDQKGRADKQLGESPNAERLQSISELMIHPNGQILAVDERTNAVHIFDAKGQWRTVCKPQKPFEPSSLFSHEKSIELGPNSTFSLNCEWFRLTGDRCAKPAGFRSVHTRLESLQRRPDGTWLEFPQEMVTDPEGSLAIIDRTDGLTQRPHIHLSLYSAKDAPERHFDVPDSLGTVPTVARDSKYILLAGEKRVYCYSVAGKPLWQFAFPQKNAKDFQWTPFLTDQGRTLCLFDGKRTVYRYAMP